MAIPTTTNKPLLDKFLERITIPQNKLWTRKQNPRILSRDQLKALSIERDPSEAAVSIIRSCENQNLWKPLSNYLLEIFETFGNKKKKEPTANDIEEANQTLLTEFKAEGLDWDEFLTWIQGAIKLYSTYELDKRIGKLLQPQSHDMVAKMKKYLSAGYIPFYDTNMPKGLYNLKQLRDGIEFLGRQKQDDISDLCRDFANAALSYECNNSDYTNFVGYTTLLRSLIEINNKIKSKWVRETAFDKHLTENRVLERILAKFQSMTNLAQNSPELLACIPEFETLNELVDLGFDFSSRDPRTGKTILQRFLELPYSNPTNGENPNPGNQSRSLALPGTEVSCTDLLEKINNSNPVILDNVDNEGRNILVVVLENLERFYPRSTNPQQAASAIDRILSSSDARLVRGIINETLHGLGEVMDYCGNTIPGRYNENKNSLIKKLLSLGILEKDK